MLLRILTHECVIPAPDEQNIGGKSVLYVSKYMEDTSMWGKGQIMEFPRLEMS